MTDLCPQYPEIYWLAIGVFLGACVGISLAALVFGGTVHRKDCEIVELTSKFSFACNLLAMSDRLFVKRDAANDH